MKMFLADLHVHSRFSRATSTRLTLHNLAAWSRLKGLNVMSTGDFTHPKWRDELRAGLVFDDNSGLYRLRESSNIAQEAPGYATPANASNDPFFLIQAEISSIYKRDGAVRKVHNLVYMPTLESADKLCCKLEAVGNLASDGRPILGLDSQKLLEMVLETDEAGVLIPAHIWTPWFSLFGSKSGFNSVEACFGDLSSHIFALETGLSSDPDMNRLWSDLDQYVMVSSSDAHSAENIGREATAFCGEASYHGLFNALRCAAAGQRSPGSCQYEGTVEFFPEEGKYHLDGHRACGVSLDPETTRQLKNICPVCGKPLTVGVLHRVTELADRTASVPTEGTGFFSQIPLPEVLSELIGVGPKSRKVQNKHAELLQHFGPELDILRTVPTDILSAHWEPLGEAVRRMRAGLVHRQGGFDGEYGTVRVFTPEERKELGLGTKRTRGSRQGSLLTATQPVSATNQPASTPPIPPVKPLRATPNAIAPDSLLVKLRHTTSDTASQLSQPASTQPASTQKTPPTRTAENVAATDWTPQQQQALQAGPEPVLVLAGPGAGKTRTLVGRICALVHQGVPPEHIVAVTFTRRAAAELRERLATFADQNTAALAAVRADTLHALALGFWPASEHGALPAIMGEDSARALFAKTNAESGADKAVLRSAFETMALCRERRMLPPDDVQPMYERYTHTKRKRGLVDYADLLEQWLERLENLQTSTSNDARPWTHVLVDEIQDLSPLQLALIRALLPASGNGFFGIGDPDQAIYGFRGAHPDVTGALSAMWPTVSTYTLAQSFRSGANILQSASGVLGAASQCGQLTAARALTTQLKLFVAPDAMREAAWVADNTARLLGSTSHTLLDASAAERNDPLAGTCSPSDIAVLVRFKALIPPLREAFARNGIPCSVPESDPFWLEPRVAVLLGLAGRHFGRPLPVAVPNPSSLPKTLWAEGPDGLLKRLEHTPPFDPLLKETTAFQKLQRLWKQLGSWEGILEWVSLRQEIDLVREHAEQVRIMTLHAAKGLEFRAVFLPALEEGIVPFAGPMLVQPQHVIPDAVLAEERRLLYVGITRASEALFLSCASSRMVFGHKLQASPSRFLNDLPDVFDRSRLVRHTKISQTHMSLL